MTMMNVSQKKNHIAREAIVELCYYYEMSGLPLRDCILCYHDDVNKNLNTEFRFDFFSLLNIPELFNSIEEMLNNIINKEIFFFRKK